MESTAHCLKRIWNGPLYPPEAPAVAALLAFLTIGLIIGLVLLGLHLEKKAQQQTGSNTTAAGGVNPTVQSQKRNERP